MGLPLIPPAARRVEEDGWKRMGEDVRMHPRCLVVGYHDATPVCCYHDATPVCLRIHARVGQGATEWMHAYVENQQEGGGGL